MSKLRIVIPTFILGIILFAIGCSMPFQTAPTQTSIVKSPTVEVAATATIPSITPITPDSSIRIPNADVLYVSARQDIDQTWTFSVTVYHPDLGWDDYADGWDIILPNGNVVKPDPEASFTRTLLHPHIDEQPVTRSQSEIVLPPDVQWVLVRSHDLVDGFGGREVKVNLAVGKGKDFEVIPLP
jgi:hypothetical protein